MLTVHYTFSNQATSQLKKSFQWDFGTLRKGSSEPTACNAPNLPEFQINIPVAQVFWDPPIPYVATYTPLAPPVVAAANFCIDLYLIQQAVLKVQKENQQVS